MAETKKIKTALVSVFHKDGLDELLKKLNDEGVKFLSTGGMLLCRRCLRLDISCLLLLILSISTVDISQQTDTDRTSHDVKCLFHLPYMHP